MPELAPKSSWSEVALPYGTIATDEAFQFLSNVEELTDYQLVNDKHSAKKRVKRKPENDLPDFSENPKKKKRKEQKESKKSSNNSKKKPKLDPESIKCDEKSRIDEKEAENGDKIDDSEAPESLETDFSNSSWNEFGLAEPILKALSDLKFSKPTPIQKLCIPSAVRDHLDILGAAETGSGKTLAFAIPIVQNIIEKAEKSETTSFYPKALVLTPTRELAIQIKEHITTLLKYTSIKVSAVIGGLSVQKQERLLKKRPEILVATPGRLWAMMEQEPEYLKKLSKIEFLVIDETDRMVEKGHFQELSLILDHLSRDQNEKRQTFVFSATLAFVHPPPKRIASKTEVRQMTPKQKIEMLVALTHLREERKIIDITKNFGTAESLVEARIICSTLEEKDSYMYYFLTNYPGRTLIFANSINCTRRLKNLLTRLRFTPLVLNAQLHQKQRLKNLEKFASEDRSILLATDVAARGLDIKNIDHVIHYQVPRTAEIYVHRSGRTARASREGLSIMLVDGQDALNYRKICQTLNKDQDLPLFPVNHKQLTFLRDRIKLVTELESLEHRIAHSTANKNWFKRAASSAELDFEDNRGSDSEDERTEKFDQRRTIKSLTKRLNILLQQPLPKETAFTTKYPTSVANIFEELASDKPKNASALEDAKKERILAQRKEKRFIKNVKRKDKKKGKFKKSKIRRK